MEDGELVAGVFREPHLRIVEFELDAVRRRGLVAARLVAFSAAVAEEDQTAGFVRRLSFGVRDQLPAHVLRDHHQTVRSIAASTSSASQKSAERYFHPPSARIVTTTPLPRSDASLRATWTTAPDETPAKIPSSWSRRRTSSTESSFETSTFRSSFVASR